MNMKWLDEARKHIGQKEIKGSASNEWIVTSGQARLPAELKHINKRRKRN